jgi:hypothetical protein
MAITTTETDLAFDLENLPTGFAEPPLRWPNVDDIDLDAIELDYYAPYDLLSVEFFGDPVSALNVPLDPPDSDFGYVDARVDIPSGEVVGIQVTAYRSDVSEMHPLWRNLPELIGEARRAALRDLIETVSTMPVYEGSPRS